jgi:hypothetical protein
MLDALDSNDSTLEEVVNRKIFVLNAIAPLASPKVISWY